MRRKRSETIASLAVGSIEGRLCVCWENSIWSGRFDTFIEMWCVRRVFGNMHAPCMHVKIPIYVDKHHHKTGNNHLPHRCAPNSVKAVKPSTRTERALNQADETCTLDSVGHHRSSGSRVFSLVRVKHDMWCTHPVSLWWTEATIRWPRYNGFWCFP